MYSYVSFSQKADFQVCVILAFTLKTGIYKCEYNLCITKINFCVRKWSYKIKIKWEWGHIIAFFLNCYFLAFFIIPSGEFPMCHFTHLSVKLNFQSQHSHFRIIQGFSLLPERKPVPGVGSADEGSVNNSSSIVCKTKCPFLLIYLNIFQKRRNLSKLLTMRQEWSCNISCT